mgnify:CR=1 FL=1
MIGSILAGVIDPPCGIRKNFRYDSAKAIAMHSAPKTSSLVAHPALVGISSFRFFLILFMIRMTAVVIAAAITRMMTIASAIPHHGVMPSAFVNRVFSQFL